MTDLRSLPSWKYFAWGLLNGLLLGISIKHQVDISEEGILAMVLEAFKPLLASVNISTWWITIFVFLIGIISLFSLIGEAIIVYAKGWPPRIIAACGFLSLFLIILGFDKIGVAFLIGGAIMVAIFPNE